MPETGHESLKSYERGTQTFLGQTGHWHVVRSSHGPGTGRQWVKGKIEDCEAARRARLVRA